jgi:hypothetical protein
MEDQEGLVLQGCGGDPQEWLDGINEILAKEGILKKGAGFEEAYTFRHDGLTCMLFPFKEDAEYQLGKIYYFGNGIRADREKGLEYLARSAAHGNMYAENLLRVIRQQHIRGAASLIAQLGRMFQEKEQRQDRVRHQQPDRKQRRQIDEKKQAMGIRD